MNLSLDQAGTDGVHADILAGIVGRQIAGEAEHTGFGAEEQEIGDFAEDLASTMLATTLGIDFDPETAYDERRQTYLMSGKIIDSASMPCVTTGETGMWTTTISAVVFIP